MSSNNKKTLSEVPDNIAIAQLEHFGDKLTIPENMSLDQAIELIERRQAYLEEEMKFHETFNFFPYDGANALNVVLERIFGWSCAEPTPGFFGPNPPALVNIEVAPKVYRKVPWGRFSLPGMEGGWIACNADYDGKNVKFALTGVIKRKYEDKVDKIFAEVRKELETNSIYRGKAVKIRFKDEDGDDIAMPTPEFMDLTDVDENMLIYSDALAASIRTNLFVPVSRATDCIANGIPVKRGVLLGGKYGTGKTLAAKVAAKLSVQAGNTFVYIPHADELDRAISFARQYQSPACTIFCEDIDRAVTGERTVKMDDILNIIDGIDTKTCNIITVLTSNHVDDINPALLRPGRLDAVIEVTPPDAKAVERLIRAYAGNTLDSTADLSEAGKLLEGNIPAVIAEVVKRAKLYALESTAPGAMVTGLTEADIVAAAQSIKAQVDLLERRTNAGKPEPLPSLEKTLVALVRHSITNSGLNLQKDEYQSN